MPVYPQLDATRPTGSPGTPKRKRTLAWIAVFALCVAAAAGGVYLATRHGGPTTPSATPGAAVSTGAAAQATSSSSPTGGSPVSSGSPTGGTSASPGSSSGTPAQPTATPFAGLPVATLSRPIARLHPGRVVGIVSAPRTLAVPILMYHVVGLTPPGEPYPGLFVSKSAFVAQLRYLVANGYQAVSLQRVYDFWHGRATLPRRPVVLSFDDGYRQDFSVVAPLLHELRWPAVLNLIVRNTRPGQDLIPTYVRALIVAGWEIDSHTVNHLDLTTLSAAQLHYELVASRRDLRRLFGVPVNFFCYPSGSYDPAVERAARSAGYLAATTTNSGLAGPAQPYRLARLRVSGGESLSAFAAILRDAVPGATPASARTAGD
jgi:peptidoglycan/xylan/chitin deacetylase (PgdA/CDA1 family)